MTDLFSKLSHISPSCTCINIVLADMFRNLFPSLFILPWTLRRDAEWLLSTNVAWIDKTTAVAETGNSVLIKTNAAQIALDVTRTNGCMFK